MLVTIAPEVRLFVDVEGCGLVPDGPRMRQKPTLILLHGGPGFDHTSFKPLFGQLADVAQVVYVDHRGHGRSSPSAPDTWTLDTFADDIVRLCEALGIERPIVLGQSFGGFVAQRYLARHPGHPSRAVLSSTSPAMLLERKLAMFEKLGGAEARAAAEAFWRTPNAQTWATYERLCRPHYNRRGPAGAEATQRARQNLDILFTWSSTEMPAMDLAPGLANVRCPVLVMAGGRDPVTPLQDAVDIAAAIPAPWGRLVTFPDAGHGAWRDDPEPAMAALRGFITGEDDPD